MSNKFRKKKDEDILIEAEQYTGTNNPYGALKDHKCNYRMCPLCGGDDHEHKYIDSIPGPIIVKIGDYVVRHPNGFLDTVGAERFEKIYKLEFPTPTPSPKDQPHEPISYGGYARDPEVNPSLKRAQESEFKQGEIPEEIKDWMDQHAETDADDDATLWYNGAKACYHKMQEEITAYKEMWMIADKTMNELRLKLQELNKITNG